MLITTRAGETTQTAAGRVDDDPGPVGRREDEEDDPSPVCGWVDERKQAIVSMGNDFSVFGNLSENMRVATLLGSDASPGCKFITVDTVKDHGARFRRALSLRGDARRVASEPNAGGTSIVSETLSMEHLQRRFAATNVVTEMEVKYWRWAASSSSPLPNLASLFLASIDCPIFCLLHCFVGRPLAYLLASNIPAPLLPCCVSLCVTGCQSHLEESGLPGHDRGVQDRCERVSGYGLSDGKWL